MAQTVRALDCPLGDVTRLSAGGGALPVIMSIIGPRETHDYRLIRTFEYGFSFLPVQGGGLISQRGYQVKRTTAGTAWV